MSRYPRFEVQYRRPGSSDWTDSSGVSSSERSVNLDGMFPDGQYEVQVRGVSGDRSQQTPYTPVLTVFAGGRGKTECIYSSLVTF